MILVKRVPWILLGIAVGVMLSVGPVMRAQQASEQRLNTIAFRSTGENNGMFSATDAKTHSCWIGYRDTSNVITALASAPLGACQ
jgi:hypothetical protein